MNTLKRLWNMIFHPQATAKELAGETSLRSSLAVVLGLGLATSLMFAISAVKKDYPPAPAELQTWIKTWGEFAMLPVIKIPAESYRLAEALFALPMILAAWMLMAGSARLLSVLFGGRVSFEQYLNLFGFSFFTFWILAQAVEILIERLSGAAMLPALRGEYGALTQLFFTYSLSIEWSLLLLVGGIYNGLVTRFIERFALWKAALVGLASMSWPIFLATTLLR